MRKLNFTRTLSLLFTGLGIWQLNAQEVTNPPLPSSAVRLMPPAPWGSNVFGARGQRGLAPGISLPTGAQPAPQVPGAPTNQATLAVPAADTNGVGPKIVFSTPIYDFGRVKSGDPVKYTYIFTNIGDQVLELSNVQPQCGCTAAGDWTRKVEPGQTGQIPIQFNTANYGQQVIKTITVASNDRKQPMVVLQLKGTLWKPIELIPSYLILNILPDTPNASGTVRIVNNMEEPLALSDPTCTNPAFTTALKTNTPGKEYQLTLSPVPPLSPGTLQGKVVLKSSATNAATIDVPFWANVQAPVMVMPAQIMLPATLSTAVTPSVTIQNNSTNSLVLSDAAVNVPGVEAQIKELQPGRIFSVQVSVPQGYQTPTGTRALLTVKTSHPQFKVLEVPIVQMPKPLAALQPNVQQTFATKPPVKAQALVPLPSAPVSASPATNKLNLP